MIVIESPGSVTAATNIGQHTYMSVDVRAGQAWLHLAQPLVDGGSVAPRHCHQAEWRVDGKTLPQIVSGIAGMTDRVDHCEILGTDF
ncbi:Uncharacterised protein [Mycobacteroides abscessus subsp. abscessus]|nr:Uncharacterised protein [Mycobacteroides abscessus subsp. abscessus]